MVFGGFVNAGALLWNCLFFSLWLPWSNGCKFPPFRFLDGWNSSSVQFDVHLPSKCAGKSRVTVFMLTNNMWRDDYSSSQFSSWSKLVMQYLLNINPLNYFAILVTNQIQSGALSDLSISSGFALYYARSLSLYQKISNRKGKSR